MSTTATGSSAATDGRGTSTGAANIPKPRSDVRMTGRGIGMLAAGIAVGVLGVGFATPVLVYIGIASICAVAVAWVWMLTAIHLWARSRTTVRRNIVPHPLTAGVPGDVAVTLSAGGRRGAARLSRAATHDVSIREQAVAELTGGNGTKASVVRNEGALTLRYHLHPTIRGRWTLGPALVHNVDPFGMVRAYTPVGLSQTVPVWPAIVDLTATAGLLMGQAERAALGDRSPLPDDASLRDYREGDDLRRVHWASSARYGSMLVRSDERAGRRPATIIVDLPSAPVDLEWAVSVAASVGVSVLTSGHPVRLMGTGFDPTATRHIGEHGGDLARYDLLNQTVDLHPATTRETGADNLARAARIVADDSRHGEVTIAVVGPLDATALDALAAVGESGRAWAVVRADHQDEALAQQSVVGLRKAGWRATSATVDEDLDGVWGRVLTGRDPE